MEKFAGVSAPFDNYNDAKIAVLPVPYDKTSTWVKGADKGPEALLDASVALEWYDIETQSEVYKQGIATLDPITEDATPEALCAAVEAGVTQLLDDNKFPVTIGGNHTVSIGAIWAMTKRYKDITILQLDAHSDLRPFYEGSELNHACVMYQASKCAPITQVGIRSQCIEEMGNFKADRIFYAHNIVGRNDWQEKALATLSKNVYITIDLDAFDPAYLPSTGTPEPGGMNYYEVMNFLKLVIKERNVVGLDVVELCPNPNERSSDFLAAKLIYQFLSNRFLLDTEK